MVGGDERSAGIPTRDAERSVKARSVELVDGAVDGGISPASPASSDAKARENLRRIGEITRRLGHMRAGVPTRLGGGHRSARHVHGVKDGRGGGRLCARSAERAARARASVDHDELRSFEPGRTRARDEGGDDGRGGVGGHDGSDSHGGPKDDVARQTRSLQVQVERAAGSSVRPSAQSWQGRAQEAPPSLGAREARQAEIRLGRVVSRRSAPRRTDAADVREPPRLGGVRGAMAAPTAVHPARDRPGLRAPTSTRSTADGPRGPCGRFSHGGLRRGTRAHGACDRARRRAAAPLTGGSA